MSRTIETKSGIDFWTNINEENMIGEMCEKVGAKTYNHKTAHDAFLLRNNLPPKVLPYYRPDSMSYEMNEEEALDTSNRLLTLLDNPDISFAEFKHYFEVNFTLERFIEYVKYLSDIFKNSKGYKCL